MIGVTAGSVYGLAGTGLVLTYKTSGIFNFAHGAVATVSAYGFYILHTEHGVPWPVAFVVSVMGLGTAMGLLLELLARRLADVRTVWKVAATIGLILVVQGFFSAQYGREPRRFLPYFPTGQAFSVAGVLVQWDQVIIISVALLATAALCVMFRLSRLGSRCGQWSTTTSCCDMSGTNPNTVRRWSWIIGANFAALAGVLLAPSLNLDALLLTLLVVQAFGAAAIGFFSSLPMTYIGGLAHRSRCRHYDEGNC